MQKKGIYRCKYCSKVFEYPFDLGRHVVMEHKDIIKEKRMKEKYKQKLEEKKDYFKKEYFSFLYQELVVEIEKFYKEMMPKGHYYEDINRNFMKEERPIGFLRATANDLMTEARSILQQIIDLNKIYKRMKEGERNGR